MDDKPQQRVREFTLLIAQLAAQYDMSEGELAAAAGGACAVGRLLRRVDAEERGLAVEETSPDLLVMLFDARVRRPVVVEGDDEALGSDNILLAPPAVSYQ